MTSWKSRREQVSFLGPVADILTLASFVVGLVVGLLTLQASWPNWLRLTLLIAGVLLVGVSLGVFASWALTRDRVPLGYRWIKVDQTYELAEDNPRVQRLIATITIEAVRDNVFLFVDRTHWTGKRPPRLSLLGSDHSLLVSPYAFEGWRTYVAAFKKPLVKGERTSILLQVEFLDESDDPQHWVSKTPTERIRESLTLRMRFGKNSPRGEDFQGVVLRPGVGQNAVVGALEKPLFDQASGTATVVIPKPKVGLRYQLQTEWPFPNTSENLEWDRVTTPW
jgi:hypothetical protein